MSVSYFGNKGGERGEVGLHLGVIRAELAKTLFKLSLVAPGCQGWVETRLVDRKLSHTLLIALPRPAG